MNITLTFTDLDRETAERLIGAATDPTEPRTEGAAIGWPAPAPGDGDDTQTAGAGDDTQTAGAGDDTQAPGAGDDTQAPGAGDDTDAPAAVELDVDGLPWDERIHASSGKKVQSGQWRKRKNVGPETVAEVEAELRAAGYAEADDTTPPAAPPAPPAPPAGDTTAPPAPPAGDTSAPPVPLAPPAPPAGDTGGPLPSFSEAMIEINAQNLSNDALDAGFRAAKVGGFPELVTADEPTWRAFCDALGIKGKR